MIVPWHVEHTSALAAHQPYRDPICLATTSNVAHMLALLVNKLMAFCGLWSTLAKVAV